MGLRWILILLFSLLPIAASLVTVRAQSPAVVITIDPARTYQTFGGWGATLSFMRDMNYVSQPTVGQVINETVNDLGMTFLRLGFGHLSEPVNDNGNSREIDWSRFGDKQSIEREGQLGLLDFARLVRANGNTPVLLLNRDLPDPMPSWTSDDELAEQIAATILYYRDKLGIDITFTSIDNEPDNYDPYTPARVQPLIKALGKTLQRYGLSTKIAMIEGHHPQQTWRFITAMKDDKEVWRYIGLLNWHLYGPKDPFRSKIRDLGFAMGIPTAQTEFPAQIKDLEEDLVRGGVSYWTRYHLADRGGLRGANFFVMNGDGTSFVRNDAYWRFRQFMRYVRPGAVRMEVSSPAPDVRAYAFERDKQRVVVIVCDRAEAVPATIRGLIPGPYAASQAPARGYTELGVREVGASGAIDVTLPARGILTLYPYPGVNQAPIVTGWTAKPTFLELPATTAALTASAQDVEREPLTFAWSVAQQPEGATAELSSPANADTQATGLTKPGEYVFTVAVRDAGGGSTSRNVTLRVFDGNQPPVIAEGHRYFKDGWIVLPRSTNTYGPLFISAFDLEGDPVTTQFTVVSQPAKADVKFDGIKVSGLTVPGTYTFRFTASDPTHSSSRDFKQIVVGKRP